MDPMTNERRDKLLANRPSDDRLTPERIEAKVAKTTYVHEGVLTIAILTLENGYTVTGQSACADPANFNEELGKKIAYDDALKKIWPLEGYLLKQKLYEREVDKNTST